jgi:hypothetical protein
MSGSITMIGVTGNATLTRLVQDSQATHTQLDKISNQVSTGLIADNYAGLGTGAPVSLNLHPQIASMQAWQNNVDAATGRMSVAQSSLTQIQSIAANFYAQLNNVQSVNTSDRHHRSLGTRRTEAGGGPAGYAGWWRLRVRWSGHWQSASAEPRPDHRYDRQPDWLLRDNPGGRRQAWRSTGGVGGTANAWRRFIRRRSLAVLKLSIDDPDSDPANRAGGSKPDRDRRHIGQP